MRAPRTIPPFYAGNDKKNQNLIIVSWSPDEERDQARAEGKESEVRTPRTGGEDDQERVKGGG